MIFLLAGSFGGSCGSCDVGGVSTVEALIRCSSDWLMKWRRERMGRKGEEEGEGGGGRGRRGGREGADL